MCLSARPQGLLTRQRKQLEGEGGGEAIRPTYCRTCQFRCESVKRVWWEYGGIGFSWECSVLEETQLLAHVVTQEIIEHFT